MSKDWIRGLSAFLQESPVSYHTIRAIKRRLDAAGFTELREAEAWTVKPGQAGYVIRNGSSIIAFRLPEGAVDSFHIIAAHSDSHMRFDDG